MENNKCNKIKIHKQAYLIVAHTQYKLLKELLKIIDNKNNHIYIHLDKKFKECDIKELKECVHFSKIFFVNRRKVGWGAYSQINLTVNMLQNANANMKYDYYHLISGVDFPLKNAEYIYNFFDCNDDIEYISYDNKIYDNINNKRIKYYYFLQEYSRNYLIVRKINLMLVKIQELLNVDRIRDIDFKLQKGANWFSITNDLVEYILTKKDWIKKYFRYSYCGDEMFLQTIVENSEFKNRVYKGGIDQGNLRLVDWKRGSPYIWKNEDKLELLNSKCLWARKFNMDIDSEIVDILNDNLNN